VAEAYKKERTLQKRLSSSVEVPVLASEKELAKL